MSSPSRRVVNVGADDLAELGKIHEARPRGKDVVEAARKIRGVRLTTSDDGHFTARATDLRSQRALAETLSSVRRLEAERGEKVHARREVVEVKNRHGKMVRVAPDSEIEAGRRGLLQSRRQTYSPPRGYPRCWDDGPEFQAGRCVWCGRAEVSHG